MNKIKKQDFLNKPQLGFIIMETTDIAIASLEKMTHDHPMWKSGLLHSFSNGSLSTENICLVFSQHYLYATNFTKLLALLMTRLDNSAHRAAIVENLWVEAGEGNSDNSHAKLLNKFLDDIGVDRDVKNDQFKAFTKNYVNCCFQYLESCNPAQACAFLAWATESIVPRLYSIFIENFRSLGMQEDMYSFFSLHVECDDGHAAVLANIAADYIGEYPSIEAWKQDCWKAIDYALTLRHDFFDQINEEIKFSNFMLVCDEIYSENIDINSIKEHKLFDDLNTAETIYENNQGGKSFKVQRFDVTASVMDPRFVTLPPGSCNERHSHAHESVFFIVSGVGKVIVGDKEISVKPNASVYVPRWIPHHTVNTGEFPLCIFAVTDFGLTKRFPGNTESSYRERPESLEVTVKLN